MATDLRRAGCKASARVDDALIAATAVARELPLYTVNPDDFRGINKLKLVEIPHSDERDADSVTETTECYASDIIDKTVPSIRSA